MIVAVPWLAPIVWNPMSATNGIFVGCTHQFGWSDVEPDNFPRHKGRGEPVRCEVSGEYFPASRIRQQWDGKVVGDIYYLEGPNTRWPSR